MVKKFFSVLALMGAVTFGFVSCGNDDEDEQVTVKGEENQENEKDEVSLKVSSTSLELTGRGEEETFKITSNSSWTISNDVDWLIVSSKKGKGNKEISVEAIPNDGKERTATIEVAAGDVVKKIKVTQAALVSYSFKQAVEQIATLGKREIEVATGDTVVFAELYDDDDPYVFFLIVTDASEEKIKFKFSFHGAWEDQYNKLLGYLESGKETYIHEEDLSDAYFEENGYEAFGVIGIDHQMGTQGIKTYEETLGGDGSRFFFEKKKGQRILTNYPSRKFEPKYEIDNAYPTVVFLKVGVQR